MRHFLSKLHADLRSTRHTRRGATHHADDIPRGLHKEYPRMERIPLSEPDLPEVSLDDALAIRHSGFAGDPMIPLTRRECGTLLGLSLRKRPGTTRRNYPSGGALYPVETYLISKAMEMEEPAVFHYNPTAHALERLWGLPSDFDMKSIAKHPPALPLSTLIVFTSVWQRSAAKYGDLAYHHALIESGHMSQNVQLVGCALGLVIRPYAGFNDERVIDLLDINDAKEQPIHAMTICKRGDRATM